MSGIADLIERLEKLEGPDREVDADLDVALFGGETVWKQANYTMESYPASRRLSKYHVGGFANEHVPIYTASLDAATALVERVLPVWSWECRRSGTGDKGQATVWNPRKSPGYNDEQRAFNCPSPAIALCLAALRALQQEDRR